MSEVVASHRAVFERLRHEDQGGEHWFARELQAPSGYRRWEDFERSIERARAACANVQEDPDQHLREAPKINDLGYRSQDYRLTRYGAYLLAMNGDPRKREIAEAQTYFAVQTRVAETSLPVPVQRGLPASYADALRELASEVEAREAAEAQRQIETSRADEAEGRVAELEPVANAWHAMDSAEGDYSVREAAQMLNRDPSIDTGQNRLFAYMFDISWVDRTSQPYQAQIDNGRLRRKIQTYEHPRTGETVLAKPQVRITHKGLTELHRRLGGSKSLAVGQLAVVSSEQA